MVRNEPDPKYAVLISGAGRTLDNLIRATADGRLPGSVVVVVSSTPNVRGLEIAEQASIPAFTVERTSSPSANSISQQIFDFIAPFEPDLIIMAGFLRRLVIPPVWIGRILNIHPALLPQASFAAGKGFYGDRVHEAILQSGATRSGATVHLVDQHYDNGRVLAQAEVPVLPDDTVETLAARVFAAECELYPRTIRDFLKRTDLRIDSDFS
jgi:phosphoribosylglycinamide formyltransferase 1